MEIGRRHGELGIISVTDGTLSPDDLGQIRIRPGLIERAVSFQYRIDETTFASMLSSTPSSSATTLSTPQSTIVAVRDPRTEPTLRTVSRYPFSQGVARVLSKNANRCDSRYVGNVGS
jgi:hypothetical protein